MSWSLTDAGLAVKKRYGHNRAEEEGDKQATVELLHEEQRYHGYQKEPMNADEKPEPNQGL
jgi:hypothetical protein